MNRRNAMLVWVMGMSAAYFLSSVVFVAVDDPDDAANTLMSLWRFPGYWVGLLVTLLIGTFAINILISLNKAFGKRSGRPSVSSTDSDPS